MKAMYLISQAFVFIDTDLAIARGSGGKILYRFVTASPDEL